MQRSRRQNIDALWDEAAPGSGAAVAQLRKESRNVVGRQETTLGAPAAAAHGWQARQNHHYTVGELSEAWNVSTDFVRDLFRDEKDVVRWVRSRPGKRRYIVIRIPANVAERVYRRAQRV